MTLTSDHEKIQFVLCLAPETFKGCTSLQFLNNNILNNDMTQLLMQTMMGSKVQITEHVLIMLTLTARLEHELN